MHILIKHRHLEKIDSKNDNIRVTDNKHAHRNLSKGKLLVRLKKQQLREIPCYDDI